MKLSTLFVFLAFPILLTAQAKDSKSVIIGHYPDFGGTELYLVYSRDYPYNKTINQVIDSTEINDKGDFIFEIPSKGPEYYQVLNSVYNGAFISYDLYLKPGDTLIIDFDKVASGYEIGFSGNTASNYKFFEASWKLTYPFSRNNNWALLPMPEFKDSMKLWEQAVDSLYKQYTPPNTEYQNYVRLRIRYKTAYYYLYYLDRHIRETFDSSGYIFPPEAYYEFMKPEDLKNPPYGFMTMYQWYIRYYLNDQYERRVKDIPDYLKDEGFLQKMYETAKVTFHGEARDIAFNSVALYFPIKLNENSFDILKELDSFYYHNYSNISHYQKFEKLKNNLMAIKPGSPAPQLILPDENGDSVRLDGFKGKVVYLSFWGTWCGPCLREIPDKISLQEKYKGQDVVFLNIAMESGEKQIQIWRDFIMNGKEPHPQFSNLNGKKLGGINVVAKGNMSNSQIQSFLIKNAPTYILINREGNIAYTRAKHPAEVSDQIDGLLRSH